MGLTRKGRKRTLLFILLFWLAGLSLFAPVPESHAVDTDTLKERINEKEKEKKALEKEKKELQQGKKNVQAMISSLEGKKQELNAVVQELDEEVTRVENDIAQLEEAITLKEGEIEETRQELLEAEEVALAQYEAMKERICFMYERGESLYTELMMGAESFGDWLNKAEYIQMLSDYDRKKLEEFQLVAENVRVTKELLEAEEEVLEGTRAEAEQNRSDLNALIGEKQSQIAAYQKEIEDEETAMAALDAELHAQESIIAAVEAQLASDRAALAEAQRMHYNGGKFAWPAPDYVRISSPYGYRMHPIYKVQKLHSGVDLASAMGSRILAAYDGKVIAAGYNASMGNYIMIDHGDNLVTVYMHASALYVSAGQMVSRGQHIAAVGSTGNSTGPHLHFSVRLNGAYVDPMPYITGG
ncbi:MAG: peptidoglycan DD-metalloendopeptidase family protein [Lachnospiraceae bacterium]|nr:peptidoglycan DD-metalloendopeptidase family protein [Lachnospiraceae bacterium]